MPKDKNLISTEINEINHLLKTWDKKQNKNNQDLLKKTIVNFKKSVKYKPKNHANFYKYIDNLNIKSKFENNKTLVKTKIDNSNEPTLTFFKKINNKVNIKYIPFKKSDNKKVIIIISSLILILFIILSIIFIIKVNYFKFNNNKSINNEFINKDKVKKIIGENSVLYFTKNDYQLMDGENNKIDLIIEVLKNCKKADLLIEGYTANIEKPQNEILLSQKRADYVKDIITNKFNNSSIKINSIGFGSKNQISNNPDKLYLNRRVEIKLLDYELK